MVDFGRPWFETSVDKLMSEKTDEFSPTIPLLYEKIAKTMETNEEMFSLILSSQIFSPVAAGGSVDFHYDYNEDW